MATFAKSKAGRFQKEARGSSLGPGDYDPCLPRSTSVNAGACSLGFTAPKLLSSPTKQSSKDSIPEDEEADAVFGRDKDRRASSMTPGGSGGRRSSSISTARLSTSSATTSASRLIQVEFEQQAKQLSWSEREREKLQAETAKLKERERALVKSESQARADAAKANFARDALAKRAESAERKVERIAAEEPRLQETEVGITRLTTEAAVAERALQDAEAAHALVTQQNEELSFELLSFEQQFRDSKEEQASLVAVVEEAGEREAILKKNLADLRAAGAKHEEDMLEAREALTRSEAAAQTASNHARTFQKELEAARAATGDVDTLSSQLSAELKACKARLLMNQADCEAFELNLREVKGALDSAGNSLLASEAENEDLDTTVNQQRAKIQELEQEVSAEREGRIIAQSQAGELEDRLTASQTDVAHLATQLGGTQAKFSSATGKVETLENSLTESLENVAALQQRLGDALADGVEYADASIRSEERLRNSEADCAALWEEREDAKNKLAAALVGGRALEEKLAESLAEQEQVQKSLRKAELRVATTAREGEVLEDELAGIREELNSAKRELEDMRETHATTASEARVLKGSLEDSHATCAQFSKELDSANSRLAEMAAEEERIQEQLTEKEKEMATLKTDVEDVNAQVDTGAHDFVELEAKLLKSESSCEELRKALKAADARVKKANAYAARAQDDLVNALVKNTNLQEELSNADEKVVSTTAKTQVAEEKLAKNEAGSLIMLQNAEAAEASCVAARVVAERAEMQLSESQDECVTLRRTMAILQRTLDGLVAEGKTLQDRLDESVAASDKATGVLADANAQLELEVAAREQYKKDSDGAQAECAVLLDELKDVHEQLASAISESLIAEEKACKSEQERERVNNLLEEALLENTRLEERVAVKEADAKARRDSLAKNLADRGAKDERGAQLEKDVRKKEQVCAELRDMLKCSMEAVNAAAARTQVLEESLKDSEVGAARLKIAVETRDAKVDGASTTVTEQAAKIDAANATIAEQDRKLAEYESEVARMLRIVEEIEASLSSDFDSNAHVTRTLADIHNVGVDLGEKLSMVVLERNEALVKVDVASGALAASAAGTRALERALENMEDSLLALREEKEACIVERNRLAQECIRLKDAGETQAKGAAALLVKSEAQAQELLARLRLKEAETTRDIVIAKNEAAQARAEVESVSAEIEALQTLTDELCRSETEEGKAQREAGVANHEVERLTTENVTLAGHNSTKQKIKHVQDLKRQNIRLYNDSASLAAELALATAILETIGLLPREEVSSTRCGQDEAGLKTPRSGGILSRRAGRANSVSPPRRRPSGGMVASTPDGRRSILRRFGRRPSNEDPVATPRSRSHRPRVALQDRLLTALESAAKPKGGAAARVPTSDPSAVGSLPLACGGDRPAGDVAACPTASTTLGGTRHIYSLGNLADERLRIEVRKVLTAQSGSRVTSLM